MKSRGLGDVYKRQDFDSTQAHSALYDTEQTATLFCELVNRWKRLGGWPLPLAAADDEGEPALEE